MRTKVWTLTVLAVLGLWMCWNRGKKKRAEMVDVEMEE